MAYVPSYLTPSSAERFFACPGSVREQQKVKTKIGNNEAGMEGTAIHELSAWCLTNGKGPRHYPHNTISVDDGLGGKRIYEVSEDFIYCASVYINAIYRELGVETDNAGAPLTGVQKDFQVETKFVIQGPYEEAKGTTDFSVLRGSTLYVVDLKTTRQADVDAEENKQLMYYALASYQVSKMFVSKVVLMIVRPRAKDGDFFRKWETTPERMEQFEGELFNAIRATKYKDAPLNPGKHCKYCKALAMCPGLQKSVMQGAQQLMPTIDKVFPVITPDTPPEKISAALYSFELLEVFKDALEKHLFMMLKNGAEVPHHTLTISKPHRKWIDEDTVIQRLEPEYGEEIYSPKSLLSPAQLEKLVGKEKVAELIFKPEGELKLSLKKDTEQEIKMTVQEAFKNVQIEN